MIRLRGWANSWLFVTLAFSLWALGEGPLFAMSSAVPGTPLERREIEDEFGREITYYINHPKGRAPLLVMIQGSGCDPVIVTSRGAATYSTLFDLLPLAAEGRFTVVAVEKPFSGISAESAPGRAESCSPDFNNDFTAERWLAALQASIKDARRSSWVTPERTLVLGLSEGAVMAALLAGHDSQVTDVISIGGSGTTQLFDFVAGAYRQCFDVSVCLADIDKQVGAISAHPSSSTLFAWGHPYKRWASFFRVDPSEELLKSKARVFLAFGTDDQATPPLSQEIIAAKLTAAGREIVIHRIPNANHSLQLPSSVNLEGLESQIRTALDWFWNSQR